MDNGFEKGINLFDTAEGYNAGRSEEIVGKALKKQATCGLCLRTKGICSQKKVGPKRFWPLACAHYAGCRGQS